MKKDLTEIVFLLDRSGSMAGLESDTIGGFNAMIEKQKKEKGSDYVEHANLKNDKFKLKQENENMKRLLRDIDKYWTKELDENIWWRLKGTLGYLK